MEEVANKPGQHRYCAGMGTAIHMYGRMRGMHEVKDVFFHRLDMEETFRMTWKHINLDDLADGEEVTESMMEDNHDEFAIDWEYAQRVPSEWDLMFWYPLDNYVTKVYPTHRKRKLPYSFYETLGLE